MLCELAFDISKSYIAVLYRSPSQTSSAFNYFLSNFEKVIQEISSFKPDFPIILGDFSASLKSG